MAYLYEHEDIEVMIFNFVNDIKSSSSNSCNCYVRNGDDKRRSALFTALEYNTMNDPLTTSINVYWSLFLLRSITRRPCSLPILVR